MTEAGVTVYVPVDFSLVLGFLILLLVAVILDLQLLARLVQNILQTLIHRRLARLALRLFAKPRIAVSFQLVNRCLAITARVLLRDLFQPLPHVIAAIWFWRVVPVL